MGRLLSVIIILKRLIRINLVKTISVNFRLLPFRVAVKLPVFVYGRFLLRQSDGEVIIKGNISPGMIQIGRRDRYPETHVPQTIWVINGQLEFNGKISFFQGSYIMVAHNAQLIFGKGDHPACGANLRIFCFNQIIIEDAHITWDCQIMDSSFHYIESTDNLSEIKSLTRPVFIGKHVWIGNRSTISGAVIPDETIVASNSLLNKDYSSYGTNCLIAGIPGTVKKRGIRRVYDKERQSELDKLFNYDRTRL